MRGVCHKTALLLKRGVEPRQQPVDDEGKPAQLITFVRDRQPLMQISCADVRRSRAHPDYWRETFARQEVATNRSQQEREWHCDEERIARTRNS